MGEVKGGDFASCLQIGLMACRAKPKTDHLAAFFGSRPSQKAAGRHKKKNPETNISGFKKP
jgi:hypothetical protein